MVAIEQIRLRSPLVAESSDFIASFLPAVASPPDHPGLGRMRFAPPEEPGLTETASADGKLSSFWKCTVFTDDLDQLRATLIDAGTAVTEQGQFGDIGYLCHLEEPGGNAIELLQRTFEDSPKPNNASPDTLGLITLRITDPERSKAFYTDGLGMQLLCTMAVADGRTDPFDLYFYGFTNERPPDPDPEAVINREWLYQRPYTIIELQHYRPPTPELGTGGPHGLIDIELTASNPAEVIAHLEQAGFVATITETNTGTDTNGAALFESPDGHRFLCRTKQSGPVNPR